MWRAMRSAGFSLQDHEAMCAGQQAQVAQAFAAGAQQKAPYGSPSLNTML
jgi:hypothetical protein